MLPMAPGRDCTDSPGSYNQLMLQYTTCWLRILVLLLSLAVFLEAAGWGRFEKQPNSWYAGPEGTAVAEAILSWQSPAGSWPKNTDTTTRVFSGDPKTLRGTFDNGATLGELRFLARAYRATRRTNCHQAFIRGLDHILEAQYPTGGWPQTYPPGSGYPRHITFNDGTMVGILVFLREVAGFPTYDFVDSKRRQAGRAAFDRGIECILKCQVAVKGQLTSWCAQHDEKDYSPRPARSYELVSLSGAESAGILRLLMSLESPRPEIARAIQAGAAWFEAVKLEGIRQVKVDGNKVIVPDPGAPPLWARFYEIESNRPIFSGRDGVKKYSIAEIESERRNGYGWYGNWGEAVARGYAAWRQQWFSH